MTRKNHSILRGAATVSAFAFTGSARFYAGLFCYYRYYCGKSECDRLDCPSAA